MLEMRRAIEGKVEERPVVGVARVEAPTVATIVTAPPVVQEVK